MRLRAFLSTAFTFFWTFVCFFLVTIALVFNFRGRVSHWIVRHVWVKTLLWFCGVKVTATGLENFEKNRSYVFVGNHQSHFDILTIFATNPMNLRFITKLSLFYIPFFGWYLWLAGYIPLNRSNHEKAIRSHDRAAEKIRKGVPIVSFPEGTRSPDGKIYPFKKGAFVLAMQAGVPIVPIALTGSIQVLPKQRWGIYPGDIKIHYGKPIDVVSYSNDDRDRLIEEVYRTIVQKKAELDANNG